jgi:hypothetical protein
VPPIRLRTQFARFGWLAVALVPCLALPGKGNEPVLNYGTGDWQVKGLGNVRVHLRVSQPAPAVWAHVPWRRRDTRPEAIDTILVDASTGRHLTNAVRVSISRESGDLLFQPVTVPGEYYLYYLPYRTAGEWCFPCTLYLEPTNRADAAWAAAQATAVQQIREGHASGLPRAEVLEIQAINDFHRFDPMEVTATEAELKEFTAQYGDRPYLLFPEDRQYPIRMTDELPVRWVQTGPNQPFNGEACQGEFYAFQVGFCASRQAIGNITVSFEDLVSENGASIPASAFRCFNLAGTNWLGHPITKTVSVPAGRVQALWFGIAVPENAPAQAYRGAVTFAASNAPVTKLPLQLKVREKRLADSGDSELWRQARLRWLDSTIGLDDEAFSPYTPVSLHDRTVTVLGRKLHFDGTGLPDSIVSSFSRNVDAVDAPAKELLAAPMTFVAETPLGRLTWTNDSGQMSSQSTGAVGWEARSHAGALELNCTAKLECDGYANFKLALRATEPTELQDIRLEIPLRRDRAVYLMGMGCKGGYRPASWQWKWDAARANSQLWIGDVDLGLSCKLKHLGDRWDLSSLKESGPYRDWSNEGRGGCDVAEEGDRVVIRAYTGRRTVAAGETLHFNFGLLVTPVKALDKGHWSWRYFHQEPSRPVSEIAGTGAAIINLHQGDALNPYINYPFIAVDKLSAYVREAHARQMKVKLYYTIRELSDYTAEFWALRSLGNEVFIDGPGFHLADQFQANRADNSLPKTGDSWLCEHVGGGYVPAWHTPLGNGCTDAAIATTGLSRWHNYYLEGLNWLIRNVGIDGLYLDGVGYDREIMKRVRKVMQRSRDACLIDFHSGNNFHPEYGLNNCANQYLELFPYIDSLWFGEGFDYNEPPDYWLVEIAGIPYGLFGEMLQGGGNPWRGMLFGMTSRLGWGGDPRPIWKVWDDFGIREAKMSGFWDPGCPVKTGRKDVLATAYVRKGKTLISLASWATNSVKARLEIDSRVLGLDPAKLQLYARPIRGFQRETIFSPGAEIPISAGRGWLLLADNEDHELAAPADPAAGKKLLWQERFGEAELSTNWTRALSQASGASVRAANGELVIAAAANAAAYIEHPLPLGTGCAVCQVDSRTDQGASWGPGLALVWPGGKTLRVNVRAEGRFGVDDGSRQILEGTADPGMPCSLIISLEAKDVVVQAAREGGAWEELARFARSEFPGDPAAIRVGKMSPGARNEHFSTLGPGGTCAVHLVQALGR